MKLKLQFIFIVLAIYIPSVCGQANLAFSGGNGFPLSVTLQQSVIYNVNSDCSNAPIFVFKDASNLFGGGNDRIVTGTMSFSVNGGTAITINRTNSNFTAPFIEPNDIFAYSAPFLPTLTTGDTVVLLAGTYTTSTNVSAAPPAGDSFTTFLVNAGGAAICSSNGLALVPTAAAVSISGRVLNSNGRGLANALVHLTDQEGNTRTTKTNPFGYYRFEDVNAGQTATLTVVSKRFQFAPKILNLGEELTQMDFIAEN